MLSRIAHSFAIAAESMSHNKIRAILTSLGIVFGVASVISMLAIGTGAQKEILEQLRMLGTNNIIVEPVVEQEEGTVDIEEESKAEEKRPFSPGLTLADARSIEALIPGVRSVSPEIEVATTAIRAGLRRTTKLVGVAAPYFNGSGFALQEGVFFSDSHYETSAPVCVIGHDIKTRFFAAEEPLGKRIKCGRLWMTVIGVLEKREISSETIEHLGIRNYNFDIYTPITTLLLRYENRAQVTERDLLQAEQNRRRNTGGESANYHQLDRLVVQVEGSEFVTPVAEVVSRMLQRRHLDVIDYEIKIPNELLAQERRTQNIFNVVLAAIASISLIVGGIGIMNIMLASVMERIREIGVRRSLGATAKDVVLQFLIEAVSLSFTGGLIGILLGVALSLGIQESTGISTVITIPSILLAFLVSASVGLAFGILPARRAAQLDPVEALRHE